MALYFPFIYFISLFLYFYRKNDCEISVVSYITLLYVIISFFSIILVNMNLVNGLNGVLYTKGTLTIGVLPTLYYCFLLTLILFPFKKVNLNKTKNIQVISERKFNVVLGIFILIAIINIYSYSNSLLNISSLDFLEIRQSHYAGEESEASIKMQSVPFPFNYLSYLQRSTVFSILLFFYRTLIMNKQDWKNIILLFFSLTLPLSCLQSADRTDVVFFMLMFVFCWILFKPYLIESKKKYIIRFFYPILGGIGIYIFMVTIARFAERDGGAGDSVLRYGGETFLNFCYYFENANPNVYFTDRVFPISSHMILGIDYSDTKDLRSILHGFNVGVFPSFLGVIMLDIGKFGVLLWTLIFSFSCNIIFNKISSTTSLLSLLLIIFSLAVIPIFGIFYYYYYNFIHALTYVFALFLSIYVYQKKN